MSSAPDPQLPGEAATLVEALTARLDSLATGTEADGAATRRLAEWPGGSRLAKLCALFGLDAGDQALLMTALGPQIDPRLTSRYEEVSGRPWATEWLACRLFGLSDRALVHHGSAAMLWGLISATADRAGEPPVIDVDPAVRGWIYGELGIEPRLAGAVELVSPRPHLNGWPVADMARLVQAASERDTRSLITIEGLPGSGRATFAACVAEGVGQRCLAVSPKALHRPWNAEDSLRIHRHALVAGSALVWRDLPPEGAFQPAGLWPVSLQAVSLGPGDQPPEPGTLAPFNVELRPMDRLERRSFIQNTIPSADAWSEETLDSLSRRRALTPGSIARIGRTSPSDDTAALQAANEAGAAAMGELATRMTGDLDWDDLVLPDPLIQGLHDLAFEASVRADTWDDPAVKRLFAREAGTIALFHGTPGTGKTMAAQVMARALGLDLYRIDCAAVVSKYIGETAKNLHAVFARARTIDAVVFFDEAEALFSRRTEIKDSHDRHTNTDTAYLLQLIEASFDGVAILASNRLGDMDRAFLRRIRYVFEFPRPGPDERCEIWTRGASTLLGDHTTELAGLWPVLGSVLDITGAQVKTILLSAHFTATRLGEKVTADHILAVAQREYLKEGRTLSDRESERIRAHA